MDFRHVQKVVLYLFLGFLGLTAAVAIVAVFLGEFHTVSIRIMLTSLTISGSSICAMAAGAFVVRRAISTPGVIAIAVSFITAALLIIGIWASIEAFLFWKAVIAAVIWTVGLAHMLLLWLPRIRQLWSQIAITVADIALAVMLTIAVILEISDATYLRSITVVSIIALLLTLWIPLFMWMSTRRDPGDRLVLWRVSGDQFSSGEGRIYRVHEILGEDEERIMAGQTGVDSES